MIRETGAEMSNRLGLLSVIVGFVLLWPAESRGEVHEEQAMQHDQRASAFFEAGDYFAALVEMEAAQELLPATARVYNIAVCHERLGNLDEALDGYRNFIILDDSPSERRARALTRIERIQSQIDEQGDSSEPSESDLPVAPVETPSTAHVGLPRGVFWGLLGATAATTAVWAITGGLSLSYRSKFEGTEQESDEGEHYERVGHALVISTDVFIGTSAALAVATLIVGLLTQGRSSAPTVTASIFEGAAALGLQGQF